MTEESDIEQVQSDEAEAEASPTKSPTTPKNVKYKTSSGRVHFVSDFHYQPLNKSIKLCVSYKSLALFTHCG